MRWMLLGAALVLAALIATLMLWVEQRDFVAWLISGLLLVALFSITLGNRSVHRLLGTYENRPACSEIDRPEITLHSLTDAVITTDMEGRVVYMNPVAEQLCAQNIDQAKGRLFSTVFVVMDEDGAVLGERELHNTLQQGDICTFPHYPVLVGADAKKVPIAATIAPARDHEEQIIGAVIVFQDVSAAREMSRLLAHQSSHDELTGLYNRREFDAILQRVLDGESEYDNHVLCYMDLDQFKVINDTCGHIAGDQLIKDLAERLAAEVRDEDTLARLGGDEFGILLEGCLPHNAIEVVRQLADLIREYRFEWEGKIFEVGVSVGLVNIEVGKGTTLTEIMSHADSACYVAKEMSGNHIHVYQPDDDALRRRKDEMEWVHRITHAYAENLFLLYAQEIRPLTHTDNNERRYEILIRMLDQEGNIILPMEYIAAAERYNMMHDLDRWVLHNAFGQIGYYLERRLKDPALPQRIFAINLSGQSVGDEKTCEFIKTQFEQYPDLPSCITFEITETAAIANMSNATRFISMFKDRGVHFSLDDFGSGLSSFAYLKNIPVDYLKIDGEFVKDMSYDPVNYAMVGSINHIGHIMGIKTIAEHVSSNDILEQLRDIGVDYGQGNFLCMPRKLADVVEES